jgi:phosphoglycolate phosphatase
VKGVAFDLDGCLVESRGAILPSIRVALVALGLPALPDEDLGFLIGPPLADGFAELLLGLGEDPLRAPALVTAYRADYREHMLDRTTLIPGVAAAVRAVATVRAVCVVTSKPAGFASPILEHLGLLDAFSFVEGPSFDEASRESKAVTLGRALDRLELGVMVGDRHHDIDAASAHGLTSIGVRWGMGDDAELAAADHVVDAPDDLLEVLLP